MNLRTTEAHTSSRGSSLIRRALRREEGQAAWEFVLVLPFFILFLLLLVDLGIMMYEYVSIANASREGARYAAANCITGSCTTTTVKQFTAGRSGGLLDPAGSEATVSWRNSGGTSNAVVKRGDAASVKIVHPYQFRFFPAVSINVVSCTDMRVERDEATGSPVRTGGSGCS